jgi:2-polyprenyl-3-methyl-5-hydroxy-6-metoxy-1,4-benzoquinol methylase
MDYYQSNAKSLFAQYQRLAPEKVHRVWLQNLPSNPGFALDIGAGSGRDANWLAQKGWQVTAIEPCEELRQLAPLHPQVQWLNDSLPTLTQLNSKSIGSYQLILVSAVWMHLSPTEQQQSLKRLKSELATNGILVITWRNQSDETERQFHSVNAKQFSGATVITSIDESGRDGVVWQCAVISNKQGESA